MHIRSLTLLLIAIAVVTFCLSRFASRSSLTHSAEVSVAPVSEALAAAPASSARPNLTDTPTEVLMHNVVLNDGPTLKLYVRCTKSTW
jgi:hypothetical protein